MDYDVIEYAMQSSLRATRWNDREDTRKAFTEGWKIAIDFLQHNPHLINIEEDREFIEMCLFPSVINSQQNK